MPPVIGALIIGVIAVALGGGIGSGSSGALQTGAWFAAPVWVWPTFSAAAMIELVVPLAITVLVVQNGQGVAVLKAAGTEGEGAWRLPLAPAYDKLIDSRLADIKNTGGRPAGSITAAQFLQRFVAEGTPWVHLDIAGVALPPGETAMAPKGATGWGVMTLDRLVRDRFEAKA